MPYEKRGKVDVQDTPLLIGAFLGGGKAIRQHRHNSAWSSIERCERKRVEGGDLFPLSHEPGEHSISISKKGGGGHHIKEGNIWLPTAATRTPGIAR